VDETAGSKAMIVQEVLHVKRFRLTVIGIQTQLFLICTSTATQVRALLENVGLAIELHQLYRVYRSSDCISVA
jgi:hypothetical protein